MVHIDVPAETFFSENLVFMPVHHESRMAAVWPEAVIRWDLYRIKCPRKWYKFTLY